MSYAWRASIVNRDTTRSNVSYLMGDSDAAIAALEKGLEIEPDNALFRQNLEQLRKTHGVQK